MTLNQWLEGKKALNPASVYMPEQTNLVDDYWNVSWLDGPDFNGFWWSIVILDDGTAITFCED